MSGWWKGSELQNWGTHFHLLCFPTYSHPDLSLLLRYLPVWTHLQLQLCWCKCRVQTAGPLLTHPKPRLELKLLCSLLAWILPARRSPPLSSGPLFLISPSAPRWVHANHQDASQPDPETDLGSACPKGHVISKGGVFLCLLQCFSCIPPLSPTWAWFLDTLFIQRIDRKL